jgi:mannitol/fructose-specific phosphotransferase system IIA component (Ntr-type)
MILKILLDKAFFLIFFMLKESGKHQRKILMTLT